MAYSRLLLYNHALRICGERKLASLTEEREPRHLLDNVWNEGGVDACLEQGQWNFAMRTIRIDYDTGIEPEFGLQRAFLKPDDWIRTAGLCTDEFFKNPLLEYVDEVDYWYADLDQLYVRYVSNDTNYGADLGRWPMSFGKYVAASFAMEIIQKLSQDKDRWQLAERLEKKRKRDALNKDAMNDATRQPAPASWVRSRGGWGNSRRDGGNRGSLIG